MLVKQLEKPEITIVPERTNCYQLLNDFYRCYSDLADRKSCREGTWKDDEWNDVVSNTVPLIRTMKTRILEPLPISPTQ